MVPVPQATRVFADSGAVQDELVEQQLRLLGEEVVRVAERFAGDPALHRQGECDDAAGAWWRPVNCPAEVRSLGAARRFRARRRARRATLEKCLRRGNRSTPADGSPEAFAR